MLILCTASIPIRFSLCVILPVKMYIRLILPLVTELTHESIAETVSLLHLPEVDNPARILPSKVTELGYPFRHHTDCYSTVWSPISRGPLEAFYEQICRLPGSHTQWLLRECCLIAAR